MNIEELFARHEDNASLPPVERIELAALECIAEFGLDGVTVRTIALRAGLNAAAVNYYFRSKDRLMEAALRKAWLHVAEDIDRILEDEPDARASLGLATAFLVEGAWRYPRVIRAIIVEHPVLRIESATFLKGIFSRLAARSLVAAGKPAVDPGFASSLLVSISVLLGFAPDTLALLSGLDLGDPAERARLSGKLAELLFGASPSR